MVETAPLVETALGAPTIVAALAAASAEAASEVEATPATTWPRTVKATPAAPTVEVAPAGSDACLNVSGKRVVADGLLTQVSGLGGVIIDATMI